MNNKFLSVPIEEAIFTIFDTETTGDNVKRSDKPIEIACVHWNYKKGFLAPPKSWLINPQMPIHPAAIAVHGLTDEDVEQAPLLEDILPELHDFIGETNLVAHNIEFDLNMLPTLRDIDNPKIDSLRFVRHIFKLGEKGLKEQELTSHKMQELRYWLNLKVDTMGLQAHRAAADILVTGEVFAETMKRFLERSFSENLDDMIQFISSPIIMEKMTFGKYKDILISEAINKEKNSQKNYFSWLLKSVHKGNMVIDDDLKYSIEYYLKQNDIDPRGLLIEEKQKNWKQVANSLNKDNKLDKPSIDINPIDISSNIKESPQLNIEGLNSENIEIDKIKLVTKMLTKKIKR